MFKINDPPLPCRAAEQHLCEHCLSEFVLSRSSWTELVKDQMYSVGQILIVIGKVIVGGAMTLLIVLAYLCPRFMSDRQETNYERKKRQEDEEEKEEQLRFENERDNFWKSARFNELAEKINSTGPGYGSREERLENQHLLNEIEKNRQFDDVDAMVDLGSCLAARRTAQAEELRKAREEALEEYKEAVDYESYLIRESKKRPDDIELRRDRDEAGKRADRLHREYRHLC